MDPQTSSADTAKRADESNVRIHKEIQSRQLTARQRWISRLLVAVAVGLIGCQLLLVKSAVEKNKQLGQSYVYIHELQMDKDEYHPGDIVGFTYERKAVKDGKYPLLYLTIDSFENQDTGDVFEGVSAARVIKQSEESRRHGVRYLPTYATYGKYKIEGWACSQTNRLTAATAYASTTFKVTPRPDATPFQSGYLPTLPPPQPSPTP